MTEPTDTNQASEDELKKPSERKKLFDRLVFMFGWKGETRRTKANKAMKAIDQYTESLIRTEKLKLLAEVREAEGCVDCKKRRCENCERLWAT